METYSVVQAAKMLNTTRQSLFRWIKRGWIPDVGRDYKGDRIFTETDIKQIRKWRESIIPAPKTSQRGGGRHHARR